MNGSGQFSQYVTIQTLVSEVDDGHGGFTDGTATTIVRRLPAMVQSLSGRELDRGMQIDPRMSHLITIRQRGDVTVRQQVIYHDPDRGDRTLEIARIEDTDNRRREMSMLCKEKVA